MFASAGLEAGIASLLLKLSLAACTALLILTLADARKSAIRYQMLLAGIALASSIYGVVLSEGFQSLDLRSGSWWLSAFIQFALLMLFTRRWLVTTDGEIHEEIRRLSSSAKKSKQKPPRRKSRAKTWVSADANSASPVLFISLGWMAAAMGVLLGNSELSQVSGVSQVVATAHLIAAACLLGLTLVCSLQLSFLSTPDALNPPSGPAVLWQRISSVALILAGVEFFLCVLVFVSPSENVGQDFQIGILARLFAFTVVVISYVAWMIPHRVVQFQKGGNPTGWVSLAMASWLGFLAVGIVCALPASWPWRAI